MVWGLFPSESLRGAQKYYIFSKGSYRVGRKDCDITIQTDTAVSRLHADIVIDQIGSPVRIADRSKYGTWINKDLGAKGVRLRENQEAVLNDGDSVTFGTGNATFRFCIIPLLFYIDGLKLRSLEATISSIGASITSKWNPECTHVLVGHSSSVTISLIEAVCAKKPIVRSDWLQVLVEKNIRTEFPSCTQYAPTMNLAGVPVNIVESSARDKCLEGYTFILGSTHERYIFGDKLPALLEVVGARLLTADEFCSHSQTLADGENAHLVLVVSEESRNEFDHQHQLSLLSRITDIKVVAALLSGHLEPSDIEPAPIVVASSHSTDETIVADSDVDIDTATSDHVTTFIRPQDVIQDTNDDKDAQLSLDNKFVGDLEAGKDTNVDYYITSPDKTRISSLRSEDVGLMKKVDKSSASGADEYRNSDIIYSQDLIVRNITAPTSVRHTSMNVPNFKRFRKREIVSGNSFKDLIPFSKDPYMEGDYGSTDYMREERKRKQMEAIADDLFNNERARKRAAAGTSLQALLSRH